MMTSDIRYLAD